MTSIIDHYQLAIVVEATKNLYKSELGNKIVYTIEDVFIEKQLLLPHECVLFSVFWVICNKKKWPNND